MNKQIELLAPGGDVESVKAAIAAGADAVYCGLQRFNARNRAGNLSFEELAQVLQLAHGNNCAIYLTLNILIVETELPALVTLLNRAVKSGIDGIIVQDYGLLYLLKEHFPVVPVHASTQLTTHNSGQIEFLNRLDVQRVNLCRELNGDEIRLLSEKAGEKGMKTEIFVHGAHCLSFSGICYMSSLVHGTSGNRGRCSQPCRARFESTDQGKEFPLNLKDISLFNDPAELLDAGTGSLKIEGRIKKPHYVYTVVKAWREQLEHYYQRSGIRADDEVLRRVFNRDFSDGYFKGHIGPEMFIDDNRDNSALALINDNGPAADTLLKQAKKRRYDQRTAIINEMRGQISALENVKINNADRSIAPSFDSMAAPKIAKPERKTVQPRLSVILSSPHDLYLNGLDELTDIDWYYRLPDHDTDALAAMKEHFGRGKRLRPWFPAIQMEESLKKGVELLQDTRPDCIITENSGIAYEAMRLGIPWIAGPQLNITNSYSLKCLKEYFNCSGAFISNELKKNQINLITVPENFALYYAIFHPILLMTTRQCLFHGITGCEKRQVDKACSKGCERTASLSTAAGQSIIIEKSRGHYQRIFGANHMLNTSIVEDIKDMFSSFCIDLSDIKTETDIRADKKALVVLFSRLLQGVPDAAKSLHDILSPTINMQYEKGL